MQVRVLCPRTLAAGTLMDIRILKYMGMLLMKWYTRYSIWRMLTYQSKR